MVTETVKAGSEDPFSKTIAQAKSAAEEFTRLFSEMKLTTVPNMDVVVSALHRNMDTLSAVNRIAAEGAQAVAKRHMEIMQQTMSELTETMRSLAGFTDTPQARAAKQTELLKKAYERAISSTRELGELIQRSSTEALELLNHRFVEMLDETKAVIGKAGEGKP